MFHVEEAEVAGMEHPDGGIRSLSGSTELIGKLVVESLPLPKER